MDKPWLTTILECHCGQSFRVEVSPVGLHRVSGGRCEDDTTGPGAGSHRTEPYSRFPPIVDADGRDQSPYGRCDPLHRITPPEDRAKEDSVDCTDRGHLVTIRSSVPKPPYGSVKLEGLLREWHRLHCNFVVALRELVETMNEKT